MENNTDLSGVAGYHQVNNNEARDLMQPYLGYDGYYLMRPSNQEGIVCTICVVNQKKTVNYRLSKDQHTGEYFIHSYQPFQSVQALIDYYAINPINPDVMTKMLHPIMAEENYVVMEKDEVAIPKEVTKQQPGMKVGKGEQKAGKEEQKAGKVEQKAGKKEQKAGKEEQKAGKEEQKAGKVEQKAGKEEQKPGKEEQKAGKKEQKTGKEEKKAGNEEQKAGKEGKKAGKEEQNTGKDSKKAGKQEPPGGTNHDEDSTPGLHKHLPKSHLSMVMEKYLDTDGNYLLRPSSTSQGQLSLTVSHCGKASSFKINCEEGQYYINTKKRFDTVKQLLEFYRSSPIKSKQKEAEVYLLWPIPVDEQLEAQFEHETEAKEVTKQEVVEEPLPEPWRQYFSEDHHRPYYHNPLTDVTVWERPRMSSGDERKCLTLPQRRTMKSRPLPQVPPTTTTTTDDDQPPDDVMQSVTRKALNGNEQIAAQKQIGWEGGKRPSLSVKDRTLPSLPPKEDTRPSLPLPNATRETPVPALPSKDEPRSARQLPSLPAKEETSVKLLPPSLPSKEEPTSGRHLPSLPAREEAGSRPLPSLPPKEDSRSTKPLPAKEESGVKGTLPRLPSKGAESSISRHQSLKGPPRDEGPPSVSLGRSDSSGGGDVGKSPKLPPRATSIGEKQQIPPLSPSTRRQSPPSAPVPPAAEVSSIPSPLSHRKASNGAKAPPPLPPPASDSTGEMSPPPIVVATPTYVASPPAPPPPPPVGLAPPPPPPPPPVGLAPPPPFLPPPLSPNVNANRPKPSADPSSGRPFSANDLAAGKERLKKNENASDVKKSLSSSFGKGGGGMADIFSNAIDSRRKAMADSDSEESEFEDVDEEWNDD